MRGCSGLLAMPHCRVMTAHTRSLEKLPSELPGMTRIEVQIRRASHSHTETYYYTIHELDTPWVRRRCRSRERKRWHSANSKQTHFPFSSPYINFTLTATQTLARAVEAPPRRSMSRWLDHLDLLVRPMCSLLSFAASLFFIFFRLQQVTLMAFMMLLCTL